MTYPFSLFYTGPRSMLKWDYADVNSIGATIGKAGKVFGISYRHPRVYLTYALEAGNYPVVLQHGRVSFYDLGYLLLHLADLLLTSFYISPGNAKDRICFL